MHCNLARIVDLVNSVQLTVHDATYPGDVSISLLSTDRNDIPKLPTIHRFIGVWSFDESDIDAKGGFDITVRYNTFVNKFRSEVPLPSPAELRAMIIEELPFWAKIIRDNNIKGGS